MCSVVVIVVGCLGFSNAVAGLQLNNARSLLAIIAGDVFRCFPCRSMGHVHNHYGRVRWLKLFALLCEIVCCPHGATLGAAGGRPHLPLGAEQA